MGKDLWKNVIARQRIQIGSIQSNMELLRKTIS